MSTTSINLSTEAIATSSSRGEGPRSVATLLVCLPSISSEDLASLRPRLSSALEGYNLRIAAPGIESGESDELLAYPVEPNRDSAFSLTAADFHAAAALSAQCDATATLVLGMEAASLSTESLHALATAVLSGDADLALPRYRTGVHEALVSTALLYPLTRALFSVEAHLPLPLDAAFSARMATRFRVIARKPADAENHPLLWPAAEAATASLVVREVDAGERTLPHPTEGDLNSLLASVAGSLFADIEAKATFWQRARIPITAKAVMSPKSVVPKPLDGSTELHAMAEEFRNAFENLQEIWSLVLPPQSLLALKKLSRVAPETFDLPPVLWARIVYDFVLAWHLRTINRGHLLGSFTPLYLAWVTSHLHVSGDDAALASQHGEQAATAFVAEKSYLVSRWRWPDRFNP